MLQLSCETGFRKATFIELVLKVFKTHMSVQNFLVTMVIFNSIFICIVVATNSKKHTLLP